MNFQMFKLDLEMAEEPDQITNIRWITKKAREFQKNIYLCFIGEGNGSPLQYSCLANPMDGGAW